MKVVAIIQARMGSKRLPGKVMMSLGPKLVIDHVVSRVNQSKNISQVVIATSNSNDDDVIYEWAKKNDVIVFRGSENDVLDRYYKAAKQHNADVIVRITCDCPAIDPDVIDSVIDGFFEDDYDSFSLGGEFPDGLDCQVFKMSALETAWKNATLQSDREHVGSYIENTNPSIFKLNSLQLFKGLKSHRWTLDEEKDYEFLSKLFSGLCKINKNFRTQDILDYLSVNSDLMDINSHIMRNEGYRRMREGE